MQIAGGGKMRNAENRKGVICGFSAKSFRILPVVDFPHSVFRIPHFGDITDRCAPLFSLTSLYVVCFCVVLMTIFII